jgi:hypothetical protein
MKCSPNRRRVFFGSVLVSFFEEPCSFGDLLAFYLLFTSPSMSSTANRVIAAGVAVFIGVSVYQLGLFERPGFEHQEHLLNDGRELYAIMAVVETPYKEIGKHLMRLMEGVEKGIQAVDDGASRMQNAAETYGAPEGAEKLGVGLYFDDPHHKNSKGRWAIGFAVQGSSYRDVHGMVHAVKEASGLEEAIRSVRIGRDHVLKARIPWHNSITPMIAPSLHWQRGWDAYKLGSYKSKGTPGEEGSLALEVYVTGKKESMQYIDYVILMGDTTHTWHDCFPGIFLDEVEETVYKMME